MSNRGMRRKNRQLKVTVDVPVSFMDDEDYLLSVQDELDETDWSFANGKSGTISKIEFGGLFIGPEELEDDELAD